MPLSARNRALALGKTKQGGLTTFYTTGGQKVKKREGDRYFTNKKGESVTIRKGGNRIIQKADGRVIRRKADGVTKVVSIPKRTSDPAKIGWAKVPAGLKPVKGSKVNPKV